MSKSFVTGFPRIGEQRELKFALESFWAGKTSFGEVEKVAAELKKRHWNYQHSPSAPPPSPRECRCPEKTVRTQRARADRRKDKYFLSISG